MDQQALTEYRYRAVREVLGGSPIGEVAVRYGTSRQPVDTWWRRFGLEGMPRLADRSRRPGSSPGRVPAEVEACGMRHAACRMRREHAAGASPVGYAADRVRARVLRGGPGAGAGDGAPGADA